VKITTEARAANKPFCDSFSASQIVSKSLRFSQKFGSDIGTVSERFEKKGYFFMSGGQ